MSRTKVLWRREYFSGGVQPFAVRSCWVTSQLFCSFLSWCPQLQCPQALGVPWGRPAGSTLFSSVCWPPCPLSAGLWGKHLLSVPPLQQAQLCSFKFNSPCSTTMVPLGSQLGQDLRETVLLTILSLSWLGILSKKSNYKYRKAKKTNLPLIPWLTYNCG